MFIRSTKHISLDSSGPHLSLSVPVSAEGRISVCSLELSISISLTAHKHTGAFELRAAERKWTQGGESPVSFPLSYGWLMAGFKNRTGDSEEEHESRRWNDIINSKDDVQLKMDGGLWRTTDSSTDDYLPVSSNFSPYDSGSHSSKKTFFVWNPAKFCLWRKLRDGPDYKRLSWTRKWDMEAKKITSEPWAKSV